MLPVLFVNHGAGPMPLMGMDHHAGLLETWAPGTPVYSAIHDPSVKAILIVSAHNESSDGSVHVMMDESPGLLYDYGGFPPETYQYSMPNPGSRELAQRVVSLLQAADIPAKPQTGRGRDHGTFVPLLGLGLHTQRPNLPVVCISLRGPAVYRDGLSDDNVALGRALAVLRNEGVLIVGSGNTIHARCRPADAQRFDDHLSSLAQAGSADMVRWADHPAARLAHARPEHITPLLVCSGAAQGGSVEPIRHRMMGFAVSHFIFRD